MLCPSCGHENREGARFCGNCRTSLVVAISCPSCGQSNPADQNFCDQCGHDINLAMDTSATTPAPAVATTPVNHQPSSFAGGRYKVQRFLGEGGKKKVYQANDATLDREVAFALIKTEGLDETSRTRIQREAQAMGRLGSHPHIVTVFDLGEENGQLYMVTELMGGGDVEGLVEKAGDQRLPLQQAISIAAETCRGLEFAHSRGIVHRDLKPGNVWLTSDGIAKIGDFGLAVALDRSRLTTEGMMVGTVSYMPPEQAMGGDVTPRSDLYSLGAMLYEMVTGRPPFLGDDTVAIIGQHINTPPVAPTWHNSECPRAVEALILRMLSKDPAERPESASDVLAALEALDLQDVGAGFKPAPTHGEEHSLDSLAGGVFVGRQQEMGDLKACLEDALSGRGRLVTLVGEPGIGKTRIAQELATYAGLRGAQVLWGRRYEEQGVPPYWPWVQAIRSYVRDSDSEQLRLDMGSGAADIAEVVSDVKDRLPDLRPPPQAESPEQARFRLFDSITTFLKAASQKRPLVLVLDDLHWADQPSLSLLQFVARELGGGRLLLVGTYRDVELNRQHPLAETLGELTRERLFQRVLLRGLTQEDVAHFIEMTSGSSAQMGLVESVYSQTEGNPLFVTEVVRLLVQEGVVGASRSDRDAPAGADSESWNVRIPEGVREVIGRRLNRLSQRCNETLTVASILGREFTLDQLKPLSEDTSEDRLFEVLEEALAARVIEELPQSVGRYQFTHALIQETLAGELSLTRKVRLHARIAESLEELYGEDAEAHAAELVHHFAEAEAVVGTEKLVQYSLLAGERAVTVRAYEEASGHFRRGLTAKGVALTGSEPAEDEAAAGLLSGLGRALVGTLARINMPQVFQSLTRAFDYYSATGDSQQAVATALSHSFPGNLGLELYESALKLVSPDSLDAGRLHANCILPLSAEYEKAQEAFDQALSIAHRQQDKSLQMQALVAGGCVDHHNCRNAQSLERNLQAIDLAKLVDRPFDEAHSRYDLEHASYALGDLEEAARQAEAMLAPAERTRIMVWRVRAMTAKESVSSAKGDWRTARDFIEQGLAMSPQESPLLGARALLAYQSGETDAGKADLESLIGLVPGGWFNPPTEITRIQAANFTVPAVVIAIAAYITGKMDRFDVAEELARPILDSTLLTPDFGYAARIGQALMAVQRRDTKAASELYDALQPIQGTMSPQSSVCPGLVVDRLLGLLCQTMGNLDQATIHFEDALKFCRKGFRPELAWTCCDYADTLRERDSEGDRAKAISMLDESLAISSELGMRPLMERVLARREILRA
ncbi:MAG: hypothetical protein BZY80_04180 [SAR202 cluster bacterium Io17-Chloro-G2]|nr:MAG: hypothetical protein BZY80_04180 [SAR202 cluster bacterium Io17-Chloro-G2]